MYYTTDHKVASNNWPDFQELIMKRYTPEKTRNQIHFIKYEEIDDNENFLCSGRICVDPTCKCEGHAL